MAAEDPQQVLDDSDPSNAPVPDPNDPRGGQVLDGGDVGQGAEQGMAGGDGGDGGDGGGLVAEDQQQMQDLPIEGGAAANGCSKTADGSGSAGSGWGFGLRGGTVTTSTDVTRGYGGGGSGGKADGSVGTVGSGRSRGFVG